MSMSQKFRVYWRLIFLVPVAACVACVIDLGKINPSEGDCIFAAVAVVFFAVHLFRFAIGGALILAEESKTPLRMKLETPAPESRDDIPPIVSPAPAAVEEIARPDPLHCSPYLQRPFVGV